MFLVSALDRLKSLSEAEIMSIAAETALKGTTGIDLDSTEKVHSISAVCNERLSGLELICLMHAAFQRINAGTDVGVDFSQIWPDAQNDARCPASMIRPRLVGRALPSQAASGFTVVPSQVDAPAGVSAASKIQVHARERRLAVEVDQAAAAP